MSESRIDRALRVLAKRHGRAPRTAEPLRKGAKQPPSSSPKRRRGGGAKRSGRKVALSPYGSIPSASVRDGGGRVKKSQANGGFQGQANVARSPSHKRGKERRATARLAKSICTTGTGVVPLSSATARAFEELERGIAVDDNVASTYVGEAEDEHAVSLGRSCANVPVRHTHAKFAWHGATVDVPSSSWRLRARY